MQTRFAVRVLTNKTTEHRLSLNFIFSVIFYLIQQPGRDETGVEPKTQNWHFWYFQKCFSRPSYDLTSGQSLVKANKYEGGHVSRRSSPWAPLVRGFGVSISRNLRLVEKAQKIRVLQVETRRTSGDSRKRNCCVSIAWQPFVSWLQTRRGCLRYAHPCEAPWALNPVQMATVSGRGKCTADFCKQSSLSCTFPRSRQWNNYLSVSSKSAAITRSRPHTTCLPSEIEHLIPETKNENQKSKKRNAQRAHILPAFSKIEKGSHFLYIDLTCDWSNAAKFTDLESRSQFW